jgi:phosphatidate cytidylyltransferase
LKELLKRSLTGILIVGLILAGIIIHPAIFAFVFSVFMLFALFEFYQLAEKLGYQPSKIAGLSGGLLLFGLFFLTANQIVLSGFLGLVVIIPLLVFITDLFSSGTSAFKNGLITLAGIIYVALPFSLLNYIEVPRCVENTEFYPWVLAGIFFIIWVYDSAAYAVGSLTGKHKICVRISPAKSWEGLIGGAVFAVLMAIGNSVIFNELSIADWIITALIVVVFGTSSDFFESKLKREAGVKDSGNILPGHGGMLDRFDTLLFVSPAIFVWINLLAKF